MLICAIVPISFSERLFSNSFQNKHEHQISARRSA
jgi:hypothetical protein